MAQNTRAVTGIHEVPPEFLKLQLDTLFDDVRIDAVRSACSHRVR